MLAQARGGGGGGDRGRHQLVGTVWAAVMARRRRWWWWWHLRPRWAGARLIFLERSNWRNHLCRRTHTRGAAVSQGLRHERENAFWRQSDPLMPLRTHSARLTVDLYRRARLLIAVKLVEHGSRGVWIESFISGAGLVNRPNPKHILPVLQAEIEDGNWDMLETMCTSAFYADGEWLELEEIEDFDGANDLMNELRVVTGPHAREARQLFGEIYSNVYEHRPEELMSSSTFAGWAEHARGGKEAQGDGGAGAGQEEQGMAADEDRQGHEDGNDMDGVWGDGVQFGHGKSVCVRGNFSPTRVPKYAHSGGYFPCALSEFCLVRAETNTQCAALLEPKPMTHILPHLFQL